MKDKIDNEFIPVSGYLSVDDSDLISAMEEFSAAIKNHFERFELKANHKNNI